jgi:uncharacterized protein YqeY
MGIFEDVSAQMKDALRAKDAPRLAALRNIRAAFLVELKKDGRSQLPDEDCVPILRRLEKQRRESIEAFEQAGRSDRADAERAELAVVQSFAPGLADEVTTRAWVEAAIAETGARAVKDLGRVMGALMKAHKGEVDGTLARSLAQSLLGAGS